MSNTTKLKNMKIADGVMLRAALESMASHLNGQVLENTVPRLWYSTDFKNAYPEKDHAELVLRIPNCRFDVGFVLEQDGTYTPIFDHHGGELAKHVGVKIPPDLTVTNDQRIAANIAQITKAYYTAVTAKKMREQGYTQVQQTQTGLKFVKPQVNAYA